MRAFRGKKAVCGVKSQPPSKFKLIFFFCTKKLFYSSIVFIEQCVLYGSQFVPLNKKIKHGETTCIHAFASYMVSIVLYKFAILRNEVAVVRGNIIESIFLAI